MSIGGGCIALCNGVHYLLIFYAGHRVLNVGHRMRVGVKQSTHWIGDAVLRPLTPDP